MHKSLDRLLRLILPVKCPYCLQIVPKEYVCPSCKQKLKIVRVPNPQKSLKLQALLLDGCYASYFYRGLAKEGVKYAKFKDASAFLHYFIDDISIDIFHIIEENNIDMLISSPYHKSKRYQKEYDLPEEMAKRLSKKLGIAYLQPVVKITKTKRQHDLPLNKRKVNLLGAFQVVEDVTNKNILIIDDVISSANTVSQIAQELKLSGAGKVYAWAYTYNKLEEGEKNGNK